jgi:hypothetical protein
MSNAAYRTITSPGVQITEKDLTLRIENPVGTTIFVPGFAAQGPVGEPIAISTASELEAIFGVPSNAAERYFYYSCREVLNTPGQLIACRLPYGEEAGTAYSTKYYSALLYPASQANSRYHLESTSDDSLVPEWMLGSPKHVTLNYKEYTALLQGNFEWEDVNAYPTILKAISNPDSNNDFIYFGEVSQIADDLAEFASQHPGNEGTEYQDLEDNQTVMLFTDDAIAEIIAHPTLGEIYTEEFFNENAVSFSEKAGEAEFNVDETDVDNPQYKVKAGFIVLNDIQSSINEMGEGYYVGLADNFAAYADSPDFDCIKSVETVIDMDGNLVNLPTARLEGALSATKIESDNGVTSISETLEKVGFQAFGTKLYQDHVNLAVFRVRRSTQDPTRLAVYSTEKYFGSFDRGRKTVNPAGGTPLNAYLEDIINEASPGIRVAINPTLRNYDWTLGTYGTEPVARITIGDDAKKLSPLGIYVPDSREAENSKVIGKIPLKLDKVLRSVESTENIEIDVLIDAGLSTIFASTWDEENGGLTTFNDEKGNIRVNDFYYQSWQSVAIPLIAFSESTRRDCVTIVDPPRHLFVVGRDGKVIDNAEKNFTLDIYNPLKKLTPTIESNYGTMYANWVKVNDLYSGRRYWHPSSAFAAAVFARSDAASQPWYAPAGLNRGTFNAIDIAFNPNQKQRDKLYEISINPIAFFNGDGHVIMGQKTLQTKPSAFDRINVRRLFLTLERAVSKTVRYFVFEPNTQATRARLVNTIGPLFEFAKLNEGVYDYMIICDERNNTPQSIDNNELIVDIYLKPVRAAEFILINFIATRTGQDFAEII